MKAVIAGTGRMGQKHLQICKNLGLEVAGIYDLNEENLKVAESMLGTIYPRFSHFSKLCISTSPELAIIATTAAAHFDLISESFERGIQYILCEKPICTSLKQLEQLLQLQEKNPKLRIAVNHQMRFMEQYTNIKSLINSEFFGGLSSVSIQAGNFGLAMNGIHYFEMFRFLTDEHPEKVWAWINPQRTPNPRGSQFIDQTGCVRLETASGKRFYLEASEDQGHGVMVTYTGKYGQIMVDELKGNVYYSHREHASDRELPLTRYGLPAKIEQLSIAPADALHPTVKVLTALLEDGDYPKIQDAGMSIKTLIACYVSSENHCSINLETDNLPAEREFPWA